MVAQEILWKAASNLADQGLGVLDQLFEEMKRDIHDDADMRRWIDNHDDGHWIWDQIRADALADHHDAQQDAAEMDALVHEVIDHDHDGGHHHG